ncbi:MAG: RecQ family ATP-dependent DNA helicase [Bacteroidia bacterium]|nr:RecQ family ATP-dependent DNA helicase [Bacteroidia bacterium]MBP7260098.1 RecQ family ATP-dependent DNA helicase [Bacteroidia bacterium]MBP9180677.1 RecQ family ATP-dependent DNA helicase [Bacteroidia bacterium]MBP9723604.1 RecQ family ATP-dependent DNA helicase [Bacteroidia bacterium]
MAENQLHTILQQYWGYSQFRPLQEEIISSVLSGKDTLALLPTGGGKSLCFQVPAMAKEGLCLVVSPLIALMKDQVDNLQKRGIKAIAVFSGMSFREIDRLLDNCVYGDVKFLYVSPERLATDIFRERVKRMNINLLAIDEAHCISQWGYDFRPEYLQIAEVRELLPKVPVIALTASATQDVVEDIQEKLKFKTKNAFRKSFERTNLHYHVRQVEDKDRKLVEICKNIKGTGLVYVRNRRSTKALAQLLYKHGVAADFYHAGLQHKEREKKQHDWKNNKIRVMVCTNAFGMGIDKPDVRFVVHYEAPDSLEAYYQEAGRAGRDEQKSFAILLYNDADKTAALHKLKLSLPDEATVRRVYHLLGSYLNIAVGAAQFQTFPFDIAQFSTTYKLPPATVYHALKILEQDAYIQLSDAIHQPSKLHFRVNNMQLYRFQVANAQFDAFIKMLLRLYGGMFDEYTQIHEDDVAAKMKLPVKQVMNWLKQLHQQQVVDYIESSDAPRLTYLTERLDSANLGINRKLMHFRHKVATEKLTTMLDFASQYRNCRSRYLLQYFNEPNQNWCRQCDVCLALHETELDEKSFEQALTKLETLLQQPLDTQQVVAALPLKPEQALKLIQLAQEHLLIQPNKKGQLVWKKKSE